MNEEQDHSPAPSPIAAGTGNGNTANIIYILNLVSLVNGITSIIGLIMAYVNRKDAPEWLQSHYTYQIHTFWKAILYLVISSFLVVVFIGNVLIGASIVWYIVRNVKGMKALAENRAIENPTSWWL